MSLVMALAAGTVGIGVYASRHRYAANAQSKKVAELNTAPDFGRYNHYSSRSSLVNDSRFVRKVTPTRDLRGLPMYLVEHADGSKIYMYHDPRQY
jgi:hypothetical protein